MDISTQSSILASPRPPFLDSFSLSILSLRSKALFIVINFLALWFIFLSPFLLCFNNASWYLTKCTYPWVFEKFPSSSEIVFSLFFPLRLLNDVYFQYSRVLVIFFLFKYTNGFLSFVFLFLLLFLSFLTFITFMAHFSMPNSIRISWLYILIVYINVSGSFFLNFLQVPLYHPRI